MADLLVVDPLEVELGYALVCLADPKQGGDLLDRITAVRRQIATDLGFLVPPIRVRDNVRLSGNQYLIRLRGQEIAKGELFSNQLLAMDAGTVSRPLTGVQAEDPAFGLPALWIPTSQRTLAEVSGYTVAEPANVLVTHLSELVRRHAPELLTRHDVQGLLDTVKQHSPTVVDELVPNLLTLGQVQKVLQLLLKERVSIRDLSTILEALSDAAGATREAEPLTEYVRQRLARSLTRQYVEGDGRLYCFTLHPVVEQTLMDNLRRTDAGVQLALEMTTQQKLVEATRRQAEQMVAKGHQPLALCAPRVRTALRQLIERSIPTLVALSYAEIAAGVGVESLGMVTTET
jgi:flagellar biosynthesis protein FlhA